MENLEQVPCSDLEELSGALQRREDNGLGRRALLEFCFLKKNHEVFQMRSQELLRSSGNAECCLGSHSGNLFVEENNYGVAKVCTCQVLACFICTVFFHC